MYSRKLPRTSVSRRPPPGRLARLGPSPVFKRLEPTLALEMGYLRALYDWPADGFDLDFRDRAAAQQIFEEGRGSIGIGDGGNEIGMGCEIGKHMASRVTRGRLSSGHGRDYE